jgi:hypothetical protein
MQNKNILLNKVLEEIKNIPADAQKTAEDNAFSDTEKIINIAEDLVYALANILSKL